MTEASENNDISYSEELQRSFSPFVIRKVRAELSTDMSKVVGSNILDIAAGFIPVIGLLKTKTSFQGYRDYKTAVKLLNFMEAFSKEDVDSTELDNMVQEVESINREPFFETMMDILDRIDNTYKAKVLANILHHSIKGDISRANYLRHCWILANVPYIDLQQLHKYITDHYEPASSEILSSNGLIRETVIDAGEYGADGTSENGGSLFGLSSLGEEMLHYGLYSQYWQYKGNGRTIPSLQITDIE